MKFNSLKAALLTLCLTLTAFGAFAQSKKKGETVSTKQKLVITKLKVGEGESFEVRGKATFTLTASNSDGSLAGTITYTIPEDARQKIAQVTGKPVAQVPASITQTDVVAEFQKLTACPVLHLDFKAMDVVVAGAQVHFNRYVLDINDDGREINALLCKQAEQINLARPFRGVVKRINDIINGEEAGS